MIPNQSISREFMNGALSGLRVIDSTTMVAMPTASHILADMGAEVIKVESHTLLRGESGVFPDNEPGDQPWNREGNFNTLQRGKLGTTLNFRTSQGIDTFKKLVQISDVVVENNRAGTMDRLGLGYGELRQVKPDLIYLSNTGFGHSGPWKRYAGIGRMFELTCGLSQFTGYPDEGPRRVGSSFFDLHVGWTAVFALLAALHHRHQSGNGQWIDLAMYQIGVSTMGDTILDYAANSRNGQVKGNRHPFLAPHGVYLCRGEDRWIAISVESDQQWDALCQTMGNPAWVKNERFQDPLERWHHQDELDRLLDAWTRQQDNLALMGKLQEAGVPAGAVMNSKELVSDPHMKARNFYEKIQHTTESGIGNRAYMSRPWKMSGTPSFIRRPAPALGEHNERILIDLLGLSDDEITELYELDVVGKAPVSQRPPTSPSIESQLEQGTLAGYDPDYKKVLGIE